MPDDAMGQGDAGADKDGKSITNKTFEEAVKSQGMSVEDVKKVHPRTSARRLEGVNGTSSKEWYNTCKLTYTVII